MALSRIKRLSDAIHRIMNDWISKNIFQVLGCWTIRSRLCSGTETQFKKNNKQTNK